MSHWAILDRAFVSCGFEKIFASTFESASSSRLSGADFPDGVFLFFFLAADFSFAKP